MCKLVKSINSRFRSLLTCVALSLALGAFPVIAGAPQVLGYGVKDCREYLIVFDGWERGDEQSIAEYLRFRGWVAGLVTGLSLATGMDVLKGVEVRSAMRRIQVYCDEHPDQDMFNGTMDLIRILGGLSD